MTLDRDEKFMFQAIRLAQNGFGLTAPNPPVGAILVKNGKVIGKGWHRKAGLPHAEIEAIRNAIPKANLIKGSTLYVTLEPCSTFGRTPPCVDSIIRLKIRKVVVGCIDPNPKHAGRGLKYLRGKGIEVVTGVLEKECQSLIEYWTYWIRNRRPWVIAKCGMSLDGKIATNSGESQWITSLGSRRYANEQRGKADAVLVGIQTILKDNPALSLRYGKMRKKKKLWKIILDSSARTPLNSKVFDDGKVWIFASSEAPQKKMAQLSKRAAAITIRPVEEGGINLNFVLKTLGEAGITSLLVEGGGQMLGSFFVQKKVQEVLFFVAPIILGGVGSKRAVAGAGFPNWNRSLKLKDFKIARFGKDLLITGKT
jgi:diaminohydroxyphosphoribosylaminopyrimidine deaminase/5-amino-6-(5-phosphoribosylamino)uracil reductase